MVNQVTSLIKDRVPGNWPPEQLENLVRKVVTDHLTKSQPPHNPNDSDQVLTRVGEVCFIKGNRIPGELSGPIPVEEKVMVADAFGLLGRLLSGRRLYGMVQDLFSSGSG